MIITDLGLQAVIASQNSGYAVQIAIQNVKLGAGNSTSAGTTATNVPGGVVYTAQPSQMKYMKINDNTFVIELTLDETIGTFTYGSVGLFLDNGNLFAYDTFDLTTKTAANLPFTPGNMHRRYYTVSCQNISSMISVTFSAVTSELPYVGTPAFLPAAANVQNSVYVVGNVQALEGPALAYASPTGWTYSPLFNISENKATFKSFAELNAADVPANVKFITMRERIEGSGTGGGTMERVTTNPNHAWSTSSNSSTVWWKFIGKSVTPEQGGYSDVYTAAVAADAAGYTELVLDRRDRTTTVFPIPPKYTITGPGCDLVTHKYTQRRVGEAYSQSFRRSAVSGSLENQKTVDMTRPNELFLSRGIIAAVTIPNITYQTLVPDVSLDACGAYRSTTPSVFKVAKAWKKINARGVVHFSPNATGVRQVNVYKNGLVVVNGTFTMPASPASFYTSVHYDVDIDVAENDSITVVPWHSAGVDLTALWTGRETVVTRHASAPNGDRLLIFQGGWLAQETLRGGFEGLCQHLANNYDKFIFSGIETFNDDYGTYTQTPKKPWYNCEGAWANSTAYTAGMRLHDTVADLMYICLVNHTSPASGSFSTYRSANPTHWRVAVPGDFPLVQSLGYPRIRRLIRRLRELRKDIEIYGYVSFAADALYWDAGGNPKTPLSDAMAGNCENFEFTLLQWMEDGLEIDGVYCDHAVIGTTVGTFIYEGVRDKCLQIIRKHRIRGAYNITSPAVANVRGMVETPFVAANDSLVLEGYWRDNGVNTETQTGLVMAEMVRHRARQIRIFCACEEAGTTTVVPGSVNDLNARAHFALYSYPGDAYQYGRILYDLT